MKKTLKKLVFVATFFVAISLTTSCDSTEEDCEKEDYGTVEAINLTGEDLYVDVTWNNTNTNDERFLESGGKAVYNKVPSGSVNIWSSFTGESNSWTKSIDYVDQCQTLAFHFTLGKSGNEKSYSKIVLTANGETRELELTKK